MTKDEFLERISVDPKDPVRPAHQGCGLKGRQRRSPVGGGKIFFVNPVTRKTGYDLPPGDISSEDAASAARMASARMDQEAD